MDLAEYGTNQGDHAIATYRYLRLAVLTLIAALFISLAIEITFGEGWLGSISDYYYTPVRSVFVGMLITIGVAMVAIEGRHPFEDTMLNLAGALAFIVALVPNNGPTYCRGADSDGWNCVPRDADPDLEAAADAVGSVDLPVGVTLNEAVEYSENIHILEKADLIRNNMPSLFIALALSLLLVALFSRLHVINNTGIAAGTLWSGGAIAAFVAGGAAWYGWGHESFISDAHGLSAVAMFAFVGAAALSNTGWLPRSWENCLGITAVQPPSEGYRRAYGGAFILMLVTAGVTVMLRVADERTTVFWLEVGEIACLAIYWTAQTIEGWKVGPTAAIAAS